MLERKTNPPVLLYANMPARRSVIHPVIHRTHRNFFLPNFAPIAQSRGVTATDIAGAWVRPVIADRKNSVRHIHYALLLLWSMVASALSVAQEPYGAAAEYQVKAAFLYKFCFYIEWPPTAFVSATSPIMIGIAGPDTFIAELENITRGQMINGRALQVRRIDGSKALADVHLLFVTSAQQSLLPQFVAQVQKTPPLIVTESPQSLEDGGGINFVIQGNRIRFDVDLDATNRQGLRLSAQLLKVARTVRGEPVRGEPVRGEPVRSEVSP